MSFHISNVYKHMSSRLEPPWPPSFGSKLSVAKHGLNTVYSVLTQKVANDLAYGFISLTPVLTSR
jgi:hypothetical protein